MFERLTIYRAHCDGCGKRYEVAAPKSALKTHLKMNGWKVAEDELICPICRAKMGGEE